MLKTGKLAALRAAEVSGISGALARSEWRRRRLLILCFHGIAMHDENECFDMYVTAENLRHSMQMLVQAECTVLPLAEAFTKLKAGDLPPRAVVITFDDGCRDFYTLGFPIVQSFGFPATLYLTTYYMDFNRPVFDPMCSYLLWKGRERAYLEWPEVFEQKVALDDNGRRRAQGQIMDYASQHHLSGIEKDGLLRELAKRLNCDYEGLRGRRVLHLMTIDEVRDLVTRGLDIQYHTHRHRMHRSREGMFRELDKNRDRIAAITNTEPRHFCYPGGFYLPEHTGYLREYGIISAVTCKPGLCTLETDPFLLPRLVVTQSLSDVEFGAWLMGSAEWIPRRPYRMEERQLAEDTIELF
jgi:peptidoglycan/xylan/chitin deacetylase (PgdA/CDA1 family)